MAAMINAPVAIATGAVVGYFAWRQARTARDKLALDLFGERFKAWKSLEGAFAPYVEAASRRYESRVNRSVDATIVRKWIGAESDVYWLFGPEVFQKTRVVGGLLATLEDCQLDQDDEGEPWERSQRFEEQIAGPAYRAFGELRISMEPYMMLDKIAVNRTASRFRWPWSRSR